MSLFASNPCSVLEVLRSAQRGFPALVDDIQGLLDRNTVQGCLAYKKPHHTRTLQQAYALGLGGFLGGWASSDGRGTPIELVLEEWVHPRGGECPQSRVTPPSQGLVNDPYVYLNRPRTLHVQ